MAKEKSKDEISLTEQLRAVDRKDRTFRSRMTEEQQKKFSPYVMMRYAASVEGGVDLQAYYLIAANENANKYFFDLNKHPELQWLCCTTVSPGMGTHRHYWFNGFAKKDSSQKYVSKLVRAVSEKLPAHKMEDIELWIEIAGIEEVEQWILAHGDELPSKK